MKDTHKSLAQPDAGCRSFGCDGYVRLRSIIGPNGPVPVSKSTLYSWMAEGKFPKQVKLNGRIAAWRVADLAEFLKRTSNEGGER